MLNFSMHQSCIDFKFPYSNRPSKPLTRLIGLTQYLFSTERMAKSPYLFNWYMSSARVRRAGWAATVADSDRRMRPRLRQTNRAERRATGL
jgi:hypothetical protein